MNETVNVSCNNFASYSSHGAASQFKNRFIVRTITELQEKINISIQWSFFATSHGKGKLFRRYHKAVYNQLLHPRLILGVVDAIGGSMKASARRKTLCRRISIDSVNDFLNACSHLDIRSFVYGTTEIAAVKGDFDDEWRNNCLKIS
jgi:hypothetical protein